MLTAAATENTPRTVRKRDGETLEPFDFGKIRNAVGKAAGEVGFSVSDATMDKILDDVVAVMPKDCVDVERVQDAVELALMRAGCHPVAKAYILYRDRHAKLRAERQKPDAGAIASYIHASKYARFRPELLRRELYAETVDRVRQMHLRKFADNAEVVELIEWAFKLVDDKRVLPSMRSMQFGGAAVEANHNRMYNCLGAETRFITTEGVRSFSQLKHGDVVTVLTHTGKWQKAVVKNYGKQELFEYRIGRGRSSHVVRATRDHSWILENGERTRDLSVKHKLVKPPQLVGAWRYEDSDPEQRCYWAMGYVYGDGTLVKDGDGVHRYSMVRLCGEDKTRFVERFRELGYSVSAPPSCNGDAMAYTGKYLKTTPTIAQDGFENVVAFVRGYLDADGHKNPNGETPSPFNGIQATGGDQINFIRDVFPIVGAYITREDDLTGQETNFGVRPHTVNFGLVLGFGNAPASPYSVQEISQTSVTEEVWCLEVENDHSFVLENGIVTGNCSFSLIERPRAFAEAMFLLLSGCGVGYSVQEEHVEKLPALTRVDGKKVAHHVVADTIEGWADAVGALVDSYMSPDAACYGHYVEFAYHLVRPAGSLLKTSGGRAPGHLQLKNSLENFRAILDGAQGRKLRPIECHDSMCHIADAVLSGGIRRSAMICLFSAADSEMSYAKHGNWYAKYPWRENANNSVVLKRDEVKKAQFDRIFERIRDWGEPGFFFVDNIDHGTNPCVKGDTPILTRMGYLPIKDLIGQHVDVWNGERWSEVTPAVTGHDQPMVRVHLSDGTYLDCTDAHKWCIATGRKSGEERVAAIDLQVGDALVRYDMPVVEVGTDWDAAYTHGFFCGDGVIEDAGRRAALLYGPKKELLQHLQHARTTSGGAAELDRLRVVFADDLPGKDHVPHDVSPRSRLAWFAGLLDADGYAVRNPNSVCLQLTSVNLAFLREVRLMLTTLGVQAKVGTAREAGTKMLPDGRGGVREYATQEMYRLMVSAMDAHRLVKLGLKTHRLDLSLAQQPPQRDARRFVTVAAVERLANEPVVYCFTERHNNTGTFAGIVTGQCAEIGLDPILRDAVHEDVRRTGWAFCNLCEINAALCRTPQDFLDAAKAAAIIGTLQASYTSMPYLGEVSEEIARRDALLGIGMTGMMDSPEVALAPALQRKAARLVRSVNAEVAALIGINPAARTTCVKPSGTTSLELGSVGSGIHPHHAKRYIRRVTADELEVVFQAFKAKNPHMCVKKPSGKWAIEFAVEVSDGATVKADLSAIEFLEKVKSTQVNWVLPGTARTDDSPGLNHNVSNTVTVRPGEWKDVAAYIWKNRNYFTGITLISSTGDKDFAFAPFEEITTEADEARWNQIISNFVPVDYSEVTELEDGTALSAEAACAGGACAVV